MAAAEPPVTASDHLTALRADFEQDARLNEVFLVLSVGASLIAILGLLANSTAVVIGAMVVAPWISPLRSMAFGILEGRFALVGQALGTLATGVVSTTAIAALLGSFSGFPSFGSEVLSRTAPNLLDLGIALVAGGIATYARVRSDAVSSIAGTAIAVALVPPMCVVGLLLSAGLWEPALGAALLFATNLLGILSGGLVVLAILEPSLRFRFWRSRVGLVSLLLTALLLIPLSSSFLRLLDQARRDAALQLVERAIATNLKRETVSLGRDADVVGVSIDWTQNPPLIRASARVTNPQLPTPKQVAALQDYINSKQPINFRLVVQRLSTDVVGPETDPNPPQVQEKLRKGRLNPIPELPPLPEPAAAPSGEPAPEGEAKPAAPAGT
ncbi:DUF389 domain-containing protein [Vulcanococcus limneticus Candia 3F8]|nr:DUF389 domain-containing protein [Vulcanococcus limneticus MW73D5]MCP9894451.1 DUF389 domain-containing protein [Vulcanococcus limneticus Candia 3F8]MCP9898024.1 DUF389 domain-containing protein [Vulcanococcus limneticus Candia 3B3]